jgi:hypothetical protein
MAAVMTAVMTTVMAMPAAGYRLRGNAAQSPAGCTGKMQLAGAARSV